MQAGRETKTKTENSYGILTLNSEQEFCCGGLTEKSRRILEKK